MPTVHLFIRGKVQGVFYRASAKDVAKELKLTGWVKNTADGEVEAVVAGDQLAVEQFIKWCKEGPKNANVSTVDVDLIADEFFEDFCILRG